jgi:hypothetical protein
MFRVEFSLHVHYKIGWVTFSKEEPLPFAPFVGLDVLDDALGQFTLTHVAWHSGSQMFLCQTQFEAKDKTSSQMAKHLKPGKWIEVEDSRHSDCLL